MAAGTEEVEVIVVASDETERIPQTGAVSSAQEALVTLPESALEELWRPATLELLAQSYWRFLSKISLRLVRVIYEPASRTVVLLSRRLPLLRFHAPEYETGALSGTVTWRIDRGLLVARQGRGHGHLRISVRRVDDAGPARVRVRLEVRNFYPWLRGGGRFARLGAWFYARTQLRVHEAVCRGFLRSLARLEPELLRGER